MLTYKFYSKNKTSFFDDTCMKKFIEFFHEDEKIVNNLQNFYKVMELLFNEKIEKIEIVKEEIN